MYYQKYTGDGTKDLNKVQHFTPEYNFHAVENKIEELRIIKKNHGLVSLMHCTRLYIWTIQVKYN